MAVKSREELMAQISARIGSDTSDEAISFMEDVTDTLNDLEQKATGDGTDWKAKYESNDKEWREKYIARFSGASEDDEPETGADEERKSYSFDDLFKVKE